MIAVLGQSPPSADSPSATKDRVNSQRWWPTKGTVPFAAFAGESACKECHSKKTSSQLNTPMAQAAVRLAPHTPSPEIVAATLQLGPYLYRISSDPLGSRLAVSADKQSITASIAWIFGAGVHGQTYILDHDGALYESQVSSFVSLARSGTNPRACGRGCGQSEKRAGRTAFRHQPQRVVLPATPLIQQRIPSSTLPAQCPESIVSNVTGRAWSTSTRFTPMSAAKR